MQKEYKPLISIIILNFNVKDLLLKCIESLRKSCTNLNFEIIIIDNASTDGSVEMLKSLFADKKRNTNITLIFNNENIGFSKANNQAIKIAKGKYLLFLNPDTLTFPDSISKVFDFLESDSSVGAATCRVELPDGTLDYSCHRGFPSPWNAFCYFSGLSNLFPKLKIFSEYTATYLPLNRIHEIDALTGAYAMVRKEAGDSVKWFDEDYYWNGEDLDLCYKLKDNNWKIFYIPDCKIIHFKGSSSGLKNSRVGNPSREIKSKSVLSSTAVMRLFYNKHYSSKYNKIINYLVYAGIFFLEKIRLIRHKI